MKKLFLFLAVAVFSYPNIVLSEGKNDVVQLITFVALEKPTFPKQERVIEKLKSRLPKGLKVDSFETEKDILLIRAHGGTFTVGLIDRPLPKGEMDWHCKFAWYWKGACETIQRSNAHLIVMALHSDLKRTHTAVFVTHLVASIMEVEPAAIASYWRTSLQSREAFLKQSARATLERFPIPLWINIQVTNELNKGWTLSTDGMDVYDLWEIETRDSNYDGMKLLTLLTWMSEYLLTKGPVIKDNETIGDSPSQNIRVRHAESYWKDGKKVYRVVFP
jgi:hypothetical protein